MEELIKEEVIKFTQWLWVNVDEKEMTHHDWEYWYEYYKNEIKTMKTEEGQRVRADKIFETIDIEIPKGFMNTEVSICNYFIADTNDSANWDTLKFPLPKGKWSIQSVKGKMVTLSRTDY